jgi:hypothetical protein
MTEPRILHIEVSTPQAAMDAFADTWELIRLVRRHGPLAPKALPELAGQSS